MQRTPRSIIWTVAGLVLLAGSARAQAPRELSPQGLFVEASGALLRSSPRGSLTVEARVPRGDFHTLMLELVATRRGGTAVALPTVEATSFLPTDVGSVVVLNASESAAVGTTVAVLDLTGSALYRTTVHGLVDPRLSDDGAFLGYRSEEGLVVLDLRDFSRSVHADLSPFALGNGGTLAGARPGTRVVSISNARGRELALRLAGTPRKLAFGAGDTGLLVLTAQSLWQVSLDSGALRMVYAAPAGSELRDLSVRAGAVQLGLRTQAGGLSTGSVVQLTASGPVVTLSSSSKLPTRMLLPGSLQLAGSIPWPLAPDAHHPIGNTYAEYQNYGGSPYMHPGIDVLGADGQPVFAVEAGVVKAVLTTSGSYHWRVAIGQGSGAGASTGYLYAHLDLPTINVNVGDTIAQGQYLGDLVPWPVAGFTHCHFARIKDAGVVWNGSWLCTDNPHLDLRNGGDVTAPVFEDAVGTDLFAFCNNETSVYRNPNSLSGAVDIIAHVGDQYAPAWVCAVKELRYTIYPVGAPGSPVVDDKLAVRFDMRLDTYQNGPFDPFLVDLLYKQDATCNTRGDYNNREFFHILTNSDGNQFYESSDLNEAWDTNLQSDGEYVIVVTATDPAGNSTTASMTVVTSNGNP